MPTLLRGGRVHSPDHPNATALVIHNGTVLWIGDEGGADRHRDLPTIGLAGALITPAFVDAHVHATATGIALTGLDLRHAASLAEALALLERAARAARGRPIIGGGWDEMDWAEARPPTAAELDRASYGGAVYLARVDVHSAVASSVLMAAVPGLAALTGYDRSGWQRGPAHDAVREAAHHAIGATATNAGGRRRDLQLAFLRRAAELGIGSVHEMAGPVISGTDDLADLLRLAAEEPAPEVVGYWAQLHGTEIARELGAVGAGGDLFCDGSLGSRTAALSDPYADEQTTGLLRFETEEIVEHIHGCITAGLQVGFHAIGDAAIDQVLDAFDIVSDMVGRPAGVGHRIEHAEFIRDPARFAASGLLASVQPCFDAAWGGPDGMYAQRLGADRAATLNRFAQLATAGVPLAFGSDAPVTDLGPWAAIRAAAYPSDPDNAISPQAAFTAHTVAGRRAARQEGEGTLRVGAPATFAIWSVGPGLMLPDVAPGTELPECLATVVRGRPIYDGGLLADAQARDRRLGTERRY